MAEHGGCAADHTHCRSCGACIMWLQLTYTPRLYAVNCVPPPAPFRHDCHLRAADAFLDALDVSEKASPSTIVSRSVAPALSTKPSRTVDLKPQRGVETF